MKNTITTQKICYRFIGIHIDIFCNELVIRHEQMRERERKKIFVFPYNWYGTTLQSLKSKLRC